MWRRVWQPTPGFSPRYPHGQWSLAGYGPWDPKELDATEWLGTAPLSMRIWLTHTSLSSSATNEWLGDTAGVETEAHGRTSRGNAYQKGLIELVPSGFQVRVPRHHKRWISEPLGYWGLPRNSSAIYTEYAVDFLGSGRPSWDECKWNFRTEVFSSTSLDQQQRSPPELAINPRGEQEEGSPEGKSKLNVTECYTW